jgi:hypothetical protein
MLRSQIFTCIKNFDDGDTAVTSFCSYETIALRNEDKYLDRKIKESEFPFQLH